MYSTLLAWNVFSQKPLTSLIASVTRSSMPSGQPSGVEDQWRSSFWPGQASSALATPSPSASAPELGVGATVASPEGAVGESEPARPPPPSRPNDPPLLQALSATAS